MNEIFDKLNNFSVTYSSFISVFIKVSLITFSLITLIYIILVQVHFERLFRKHNYPAFYNKIPLYNLAVLLKIVSLPAMYVVLFLVPGVNLFFILYVNNKLCMLYKKPSRVFFQMIFLPTIAFENFIPNPKKNEEYKRRLEEEKKKEEEKRRKEREKSMKEETPNLLSENEYKELNKQLSEDIEIDSIFKDPNSLNKEEVVTYKAIDTRKLIESQKEDDFEMEEFVYRPVNQKATPLEEEKKFISDSQEMEELDFEENEEEK